MPILPILTSLLISSASLVHRALRRALFQALSSSPLPRHISFILDGNRRYARRLSLPPAHAHPLGFLNVVRVLRHCAELGVPYVSIFAFSIDNFRRAPHEVRFLMSLVRDKLTALLDDIAVINRAGVRVRFVGDLSLVDRDVRELARRAEEATEGNGRLTLLVCLAYSSMYEMVRGVNGVCCGRGSAGVVGVGDLEEGMYMGRYPEPDLLVRTSGEWRMSNFLLWQSGACLLYSPGCLWPEFSLRHLVCAVVCYQRGFGYLRDVRRKMWEFERWGGG